MKERRRFSLIIFLDQHNNNDTDDTDRERKKERKRDEKYIFREKEARS